MTALCEPGGHDYVDLKPLVLLYIALHKIFYADVLTVLTLCFLWYDTSCHCFFIVKNPNFFTIK